METDIDLQKCDKKAFFSYFTYKKYSEINQPFEPLRTRKIHKMKFGGQRFKVVVVCGAHI
jgi:hypothetical protein